MTAFTERVRNLVAAIPPGRATTYGRIARAAGRPHGARGVVWVLRSSRGLPWHRVINRHGRISLPAGGGFERQLQLLRSEGVAVSADGMIDLRRFGYEPVVGSALDRPA